MPRWPGAAGEQTELLVRLTEVVSSKVNVDKAVTVNITGLGLLRSELKILLTAHKNLLIEGIAKADA